MSIHEIKYVSRSKLDTTKWDSCLANARNGLIYGYTFYLDRITKHWDALVLGDYDAIMPLTWNKKWGIKYLYQPPFTQQLGIFSRQEISQQTVEQFLEQINHHFRFAEIFLNFGNRHPRVRNCSNYILPLDGGYNAVSSCYAPDAARNIHRSNKFELKYVNDIKLDIALKAYRSEYGSRIPHLGAMDFHRFQQLCEYALSREELIVRGIVNAQNEILAVAVLFQKNNRLYLIQSTTFSDGRKVEANYRLVDQLIREFAGRDFVVDFEGSDIPGIAYFYKNFGAVDQPYFFYRVNRLPLIVRWMKPREDAQAPS